MRNRKLKHHVRKSVLPKKNATRRRVAERRAATPAHAAKTQTGILAHIALALARGYADLFYVDMESGDYIEYHTDDDYGVLTEARRGLDIFEACKIEAQTGVHEDDREKFLTFINRDFLRKELANSPVCELTYRRVLDGRDPFYVLMRISKVEGEDAVVMAAANIDEAERARRQILEERTVHARLNALTGNFIVVYVVDPQTNEYHEFSSSTAYEEGLEQDKTGSDFFSQVRNVAREVNYPEDLERFLSVFDKDTILSEIDSTGIFTLNYRIMMEGTPLYVRLSAAMVEEEGDERLIVGLQDIDAQVRAELEMNKRLSDATSLANIDALTGVKNKHAYLEHETMMDRKIHEHHQDPFAISIFDVNDLKTTNDTKGHQAGDELIRSACKIICDTFDHSPVFRVGGDEFAVVSQGPDYEIVEELVWKISDHNVDAIRGGGVVIACGMSKFDGDTCVAEVFERADQDMYANKNELKTVSAELLAQRNDEARPLSEPENARYDYLTRLLTMSAFLERCDELKLAIEKAGHIPTMLFADLAGMKFVNTKHGFAEGDKILKEFALLLIRSFGRDNCCRIGADHFAVACDEVGLEQKIERVFREFKDSCDKKAPPVRVGIYLNTVEDIKPSSACDRAKLACETLKNVYASEYAYYDDELREQAVLRQYIVENFDRACSERWIKAYLQPIIRGVNECVCDAEMLARWHDPERGVLSPIDFIPALEEVGLIYKLDLYMVDRVLDAIQEQLDEDFTLVPHSINFSRMDFDACDVVEEVRRRVDDAGIDRKWITIEITESVIGSNMEFMKEQIRRFQELGFAVWMDDFGSGYSSLDVLQTIKFDTLKFDLSFMRKFDENEESRIVLTELVRMASALGVDTLCEGVETEEQMRFLQEIGCTKMQGYYFRPPVPFERIIEKHREGSLHQNENPLSVSYLEKMGRISLFDLNSVLSREDEASAENAFATLPMGIIEIRDNSTRWARSNESYRRFVRQKLGFELSQLGTDFVEFDDEFMCFLAESFRDNGEQRVFYDQKMPDGSIVHSIARLIDTDPVTSTMAIVVAVLSISDPSDAASYSDVARALSKDYRYLYLVDLSDDSFIEYSTKTSSETLAIERHGEDFFSSAVRDAKTHLDIRDQDFFISSFKRENVLADIEEQGAYTITYRLFEDGVPTYVHMKVTKLDDDASERNRLIIGVSVVDSQIRQQEKQRAETEKLQQEKAALGRLAVLSDEDYVVLYSIDPASGAYTQYNPSESFENLGLAHEGTDFFSDVVKDAQIAIPQEDMEHHLATMSEENFMKTLREEGRFAYNYRLFVDGKPEEASLKAVLMEEDGKETVILGVMMGHR